MKIDEKGKAKILIIEDEKGIRNFLSYELSQLGYVVNVADDGEEGVGKAKEMKYDVIICDIMMPKLNGLQALKIIKKVSPETEVIMITGYATVENALQSMRDGAYGFIQKPFNTQELFTLIEKALEKSELRTLIAIYQSSQAVFSKLRLEELLPLMIKLLKDAVKVSDIVLLLFDHENQPYLAAATFSLTNYSLKDLYISMANRLYSSGKLQKSSLVIDLNQEKSTLFPGLKINPDMKYLAVYPITLPNRKFGTLLVSRKKEFENFNQTDKHSLSIFVSQMAQSIANTKLFEQLEIKISELESTNMELEQIKKQLDSATMLYQAGSGVAKELDISSAKVLSVLKSILEMDKLPQEIKKQIMKVKEEVISCQEKVKKDIKKAKIQ
ncbi:MAG: response regulator [Endomicrobiales bacterium]|nr:response regulator [Endomicrobiales bacterium]